MKIQTDHNNLALAFLQLLKKIIKKRHDIQSKTKTQLILANISWNSKNWKASNIDDSSGHEWVAKGNISHESWNFDFDNPRNTGDKVLGFAKFTKPPKIEGKNNCLKSVTGAIKDHSSGIIYNS